MAYAETNDTYFAVLPDEEIGDALVARVDKYYEILRYSEVFKRQCRAYRQFYGNDDRGGSSELTQGGDDGETWTASPNEFRMLVQRTTNLTTSARLNFEPRAKNGDADEEALVRIAKAQIDDYLSNMRWENQIVEGHNINQLLGEVFGVVEWDSAAGEELLPANPITESAEPINAGDNRLKIVLPVDMIRDIARMDSQSPWYIHRELENKYDLAARFPHMADKILSCGINQADYVHYYGLSMMTDWSEMVPVYTFYHKRTPACPSGRLVRFVAADAVLVSMELPYSAPPIVRSSVGEVYGAWWGYTSTFDALGTQDLYNALFTAVTSNNMNNALQLLFLPLGSSIRPENVLGGAKVVYHPPGFEPKAGNLTSSAPETFKTMEIAQALSSSVMGLNDLAMGKLPYAGIPAELASLMTDAAVQFNKGAERAFAFFSQEIMQRALQNLGEFAAGERLVRLLGEHDRAMVESYNPQMFTRLGGIQVTLSSAVSRTQAGQMAQLKMLMEAPTPEDRKMVQQVLNTGTYEPVVEPENDLELLLRWERQQIMDPSKPVPPATPFDNHILHLENATKVTYLPVARQNPAILERVMQYIEGCRQAQQMATQLGLPPPMGDPPMPPPGVESLPAPEEQAPPATGAGQG